MSAPAESTLSPYQTSSVEAHTRAPRWHALLIGVLPFILIAGCFTAPFTSFDDGEHLKMDVAGNIIGTPSLKSFVLTMNSYKLDQALFESWMTPWLGSFAPGVRLMSCIYHAFAALVLWRILLRLRLSPNAALAGALLFAIHPMACETVCWASERKNTLASLFGFLAIFSVLKFPPAKAWPLALLCFTLAMLGKPTAVGFLPVLACLSLYRLTPDARGAGSEYVRPGAKDCALALAPLVVFLIPAGYITFLAIDTHKDWLMKPPGGTVFTALLTDLEIICRYIGNALVPMNLSAIYFVAPVETILDPRVFVFGALLALIVGITVWLSDRRWLSALGWLWCFGAMGANLNIVAISFWMQDRYFYLGSPGFWIAIILAFLGLARRIRVPASVLRVSAATYVTLIAAGGLMRGPVWRSSYSIFDDAARKQPNAAFAHYGLGSAWAEEWSALERNPNATPEAKKAARTRWMEEWTLAVNCSDVRRFSAHQEMALIAGELANERNQLAIAELYWNTAAYPPPDWPVIKEVKAKALCWLSLLNLSRRAPERAWQYADEAVDAFDGRLTREKRAAAARVWADAIAAQDAARAQELRSQADADDVAARNAAL